MHPLSLLLPCDNVLRCSCASQGSSNSLVGFASAISLCFCSGLAGVFFELMLKVWRESTSFNVYRISGRASQPLKRFPIGRFGGLSGQLWPCPTARQQASVVVATTPEVPEDAFLRSIPASPAPPGVTGRSSHREAPPHRCGCGTFNSGHSAWF